MLRKNLLLAVFLMACPSVFASHPHDRVCVQSKFAPFVFQYSVGREYKRGVSSDDDHAFMAEAAYSQGDWMDAPAVVYRSSVVVMPPSFNITKIPVVLKSKTGAVLFDGFFDQTTELLNGKFTVDSKVLEGKSQLRCINHPRMVLQSTDQDSL